MKLLYQSFSILNLLSKNSKPAGGAAVEWFVWIRAFRKLNYDFGLLTYRGISKDLRDKYDFDFVESYSDKDGIPFFRRFTHRIPKSYKAIKDYNPDFILQACAGVNTGILGFISKLLKKPFIHRIGSDMDVDGRINKTLSFIDQKFYYYGIRSASHISCQNKYQYTILKKKYPDKSISILYNPFFVKEEIKKLKNERKYIAWIGNFRSEKNLPALAETAKNLPKYKFKVAGANFAVTDEDTKNGLEILKKLKNVEFVGLIDNEEIPEFLSKAYCLLNTSRLEGFSNTFLEAWSVGTPVVSTQNVNPDNIIIDYNVGKIAESYDQLPEIIHTLISTGEYKQYENICKNYVQTNHDPIKLAKIFLAEMQNSTRK